MVRHSWPCLYHNHGLQKYIITPKLPKINGTKTSKTSPGPGVGLGPALATFAISVTNSNIFCRHIICDNLTFLSSSSDKNSRYVHKTPLINFQQVLGVGRYKSHEMPYQASTSHSHSQHSLNRRR